MSMSNFNIILIIVFQLDHLANTTFMTLNSITYNFVKKKKKLNNLLFPIMLINTQILDYFNLEKVSMSVSFLLYINNYLMTHVNDSTNRNFASKIVLIYYLKNLILIFFN